MGDVERQRGLHRLVAPTPARRLVHFAIARVQLRSDRPDGLAGPERQDHRSRPGRGEGRRGELRRRPGPDPWRGHQPRPEHRTDPAEGGSAHARAHPGPGDAERRGVAARARGGGAPDARRPEARRRARARHPVRRAAGDAARFDAPGGGGGGPAGPFLQGSRVRRRARVSGTPVRAPVRAPRAQRAPRAPAKNKAARDTTRVK